jgi:MoaD family protein
MKVKVAFHGEVRRAAGTPGLELELRNGSTVRAVLQLLRDQFNTAFRELVGEGEEALRRVTVFLNGENILIKEGLETPVKDGDELYIFTPVAGGA